MAERQNIILITIDCLRADYCGWLNPENKEITPFLNTLSKEGIVFTSAYATGPSTPFAFPGILTGTYPLSFKGWDGKTFPGLSQRPYLPEILRKNGYYTIAIHDNPYLSSFFGYDKGFDIFRDLKKGDRIRQLFDGEKIKKSYIFNQRIFKKLQQCTWYRSFKEILSKKIQKLDNFLKKTVFWREEDKALTPFACAQEINEAVLEEMRFSQGPWFLWIHYMDPHEPYFPPKELLPLNISRKDLEKANIQYTNFMLYKDKKIFGLIKELYQLNIKHLDQQIFQLFHKLKDKIKNSIIVITADHGQEFGEHGGAGHSSNKTDSKLYKELLHVPLMIVTPNQKGSIINRVVSCAQIPATVLKLIDVEPPLEMEPCLFNETKTKIYSETILRSSPLFDQVDLTTKQEITHTE